ncbi:MAG: hypothetical protein ABR915_09130 [Thermoguttaceae bacterium]
MTRQAADIYGTAFKNGTVTLMARVLGYDGAPVRRADVAAAVYSIYFLDEQDVDARTPVSGHQDVSLAVADVVSDQLRTGAPWDSAADPEGYNFCHTPNVLRHHAFPAAGLAYLVEYCLTPSVAAAAGQPILARFRINVI